MLANKKECKNDRVLKIFQSVRTYRGASIDSENFMVTNIQQIDKLYNYGFTTLDNTITVNHSLIHTNCDLS